MIQNPCNFGCREISVENQAGFFSDLFFFPLATKGITNRCCTTVLPDNCRRYRFSSMPVPNNHRFTLIGNSNRANIRMANPCTFHGLPCDSKLGFPNFPGIVLHPAWPGKMLGKRGITSSEDATRPVESQHGGPRGALVDGEDRCGHPEAPFQLWTSTLVEGGWPGQAVSKACRPAACPGQDSQIVTAWDKCGL